jgi:hypothetical protein
MKVDLFGGAPPYAVSWSFGDGTSSTVFQPSHSYPAPGTYELGIVATDSLAHRISLQATVHVPATVVGIAGVLQRGPNVATTPSTFWSLDAQTNCATCIWTHPSVRSYLNQTPFTWVRYGTNVDRCNASTDTEYSDSGAASPGCAFDLLSLKSWCAVQTPRCHTVIGLPGENNNSREDAAIAKWIVHTIGLQPDYWAIGNEPTQWKHYGIPWGHWSTADSSKPSPLAYAFDVRAAIRAVSAVDPSAKFIGIEAACSCNTEWITDIGKIDGSAIDAIAYHTYPSLGLAKETVGQLYAPLSSRSNLTSSFPSVRASFLAGCASCGSMPIFVNEYNAGPGWSPSNQAGTYANAVFLAASVTQALRANVTQLTVYNLQTTSTKAFGYSLINASGSPGPDGLLFSKVLNYLVLGRVSASSIATSVGGVFDVVTRNGSSGSALVVNSNLTKTLALSFGAGFNGTLGSALYWSPGMAAPKQISATAGSFSIAPQGILLVRLHGASGGIHPLTAQVVTDFGLNPVSPSHPREIQTRIART